MSRQILLCSIAIALLASAACSKRTTESARAEFASLRDKAEAGNAAAQFDLGIMYRAGAGVPKDEVEAVKWYRKSAEQGNDRAQFNLGFMYATGDGVPKDAVEAVKWYRLAAEQGTAAAQSNLGLMYDNGTGVPKDLVQAHMWWNIAGAKGNEGAKKNLAEVEKQMSSEQKAEATMRARELFERLPKQ